MDGFWGFVIFFRKAAKCFFFFFLSFVFLVIVFVVFLIWFLFVFGFYWFFLVFVVGLCVPLWGLSCMMIGRPFFFFRASNKQILEESGVLSIFSAKILGMSFSLCVFLC